jgi:hypothetical protein
MGVERDSDLRRTQESLPSFREEPTRKEAGRRVVETYERMLRFYDRSSVL